MRSITLPLFSLGLLSLAVAEATTLPSLLHEKRNHVPAGWSHSRKHHAMATLPLRFALSQPNIHAIDQYINDVAHPDSPNYGNHWAAAQVVERFAPSHDTIHLVKTWLLDSGFARERIRITNFGGWIELNATVHEAENLLRAEYHVYKHASGKEHVSCESYHLPAHVSPHVDLVTPTVHFNAIISQTPQLSRLQVRGSGSPIEIGAQGERFNGPKTTGMISEIFNKLDKCDQMITPLCLRALYGLEYKPHPANNNSFAIAEFTPGAYIPSDLDNFGKTYAPDIVGKRPKLVSIDGGSVQTTMVGFEYNGESNLDLQYGMALVTGLQDVILYQLGDTIQHASDNNLLNAFDGFYCDFDGGDDPNVDGIYPDQAPGGYKGKEDCGTIKPSNVISISYYYNEADLTPAYTARQCAEFAKLGLMGVTVLFASGDNGVAGLNNICLNSDGSQSADGKIFSPSFPGTCPYVTSVGATQVNLNSTVYQPESACEQLISSGFLYSGGGFSNHFSTPDYQQDALQSYLTNYPTSYSLTTYNSTGRAHPDLSANGAKYAISLQGNFTRVYGTSASTPVVGAILTLVNDARLFAGKKPIGFINPTIYSSSFADAFHDITNGTNPGCGTLGFNATKGWDPVTGLGTPNFPKLIEKWLALP